MKVISSSDITFITTTRKTKWSQISQQLVRHFFPGSPLLVIDGSKCWPDVWFRWISHLPEIQTKYFIMFDEDCFILSAEEIIKIFFDFDEYTLAGIPDSFSTLRKYNEIALNPFFLMGDVAKLKDVLAKSPDYRLFRFKPKYFKTAKYNFPVESQGTAIDYELFYSLFWAVLEANEKLLYLYPKDDFSFDPESSTPCTRVRLLPDTKDLCIHAWYSRDWDSSKHINRYSNLERYLNKILNP